MQHDLAAGPDGQCVMCRRERRSAAPASEATNATRNVLMGGAAVLLATFALGIGYRAFRDRAIVADTTAAMTTSTATTSAPASPSPTIAPTAPATTTRNLQRDLDDESRRLAQMTEDERRRAAQTTEDQRRKAEQKQQALASVRIVVYTTQWCGVCKRAKAWLQSSDIPYEERDVDASPTFDRELRERNARRSIPTFDVEGEIAVGFSESGVLAMREAAAARKMPK